MISWNNRRRLAAAALLAVLGIAAVSTVSSPRADERPTNNGVVSPSSKLVMHEWGTFTSFSGSDGVQLDFRPLNNEDLPDFVFDRSLQSGLPLWAKTRIRARVRMETPVTYFYTDVERTIRASVEFPDGLLTEFYPPVKTMAPEFDRTDKFGNSKLDWGDVHLIPPAMLAPVLNDKQTSEWLLGMIQQRITPHDNNATNHYYPARETDSAFVHVRLPESAPFKPHGDFIEKFLFYRGVGKFDQPLQVTIADHGQIQITNKGTLPIHSLFRVTVSNNVMSSSHLDQIEAGATLTFPVSEEPATSQQIQAAVAEALVHEHLYPREALAMVKTWADSWFAEEGTRIFYMVPREITDKVLPLTIDPVPSESVRVLVGRVEVMSPSVEQELLEVVRLRAKHRAVLTQRQAEAQTREPINLPIPSRLKKLGRLTEPALVRIRELAKDELVSREAILLLDECQKALDNNGGFEETVSTTPND